MATPRAKVGADSKQSLPAETPLDQYIEEQKITLDQFLKDLDLAPGIDYRPIHEAIAKLKKEESEIIEAAIEFEKIEAEAKKNAEEFSDSPEYPVFLKKIDKTKQIYQEIIRKHIQDGLRLIHDLQRKLIERHNELKALFELKKALASALEKIIESEFIAINTLQKDTKKKDSAHVKQLIAKFNSDYEGFAKIIYTQGKPLKADMVVNPEDPQILEKINEVLKKLPGHKQKIHKVAKQELAKLADFPKTFDDLIQDQAHKIVIVNQLIKHYNEEILYSHMATSNAVFPTIQRLREEAQQMKTEVANFPAEQVAKLVTTLQKHAEQFKKDLTVESQPLTEEEAKAALEKIAEAEKAEAKKAALLAARVKDDLKRAQDEYAKVEKERTDRDTVLVKKLVRKITKILALESKRPTKENIVAHLKELIPKAKAVYEHAKATEASETKLPKTKPISPPEDSNKEYRLLQAEEALKVEKANLAKFGRQVDPNQQFLDQIKNLKQRMLAALYLDLRQVDLGSEDDEIIMAAGFGLTAGYFDKTVKKELARDKKEKSDAKEQQEQKEIALVEAKNKQSEKVIKAIQQILSLFPERVELGLTQVRDKIQDIINPADSKTPPSHKLRLVHDELRKAFEADKKEAKQRVSISQTDLLKIIYSCITDLNKVNDSTVTQLFAATPFKDWLPAKNSAYVKKEQQLHKVTTQLAQAAALISTYQDTMAHIPPDELKSSEATGTILSISKAIQDLQGQLHEIEETFHSKLQTVERAATQAGIALSSIQSILETVKDLDRDVLVMDALLTRSKAALAELETQSEKMAEMQTRVQRKLTVQAQEVGEQNKKLAVEIAELLQDNLGMFRPISRLLPRAKTEALITLDEFISQLRALQKAASLAHDQFVAIELTPQTSAPNAPKAPDVPKESVPVTLTFDQIREKESKDKNKKIDLATKVLTRLHLELKNIDFGEDTKAVTPKTKEPKAEDSKTKASKTKASKKTIPPLDFKQLKKTIKSCILSTKDLAFEPAQAGLRGVISNIKGLLSEASKAAQGKQQPTATTGEQQTTTQPSDGKQVAEQSLQAQLKALLPELNKYLTSFKPEILGAYYEVISQLPDNLDDVELLVLFNHNYQERLQQMESAKMNSLEPGLAFIKKILTARLQEGFFPNEKTLGFLKDATGPTLKYDYKKTVVDRIKDILSIVSGNKIDALTRLNNLNGFLQRLGGSGSREIFDKSNYGILLKTIRSVVFDVVTKNKPENLLKDLTEQLEKSVLIQPPPKPAAPVQPASTQPAAPAKRAPAKTAAAPAKAASTQPERRPTQPGSGKR